MKGTFFTLLAGPVVLLSAQPVFAEDQAGPAPAAQSSAQSASSDIIVTAERRSERLENVPASVIALSPATLTNAGVTSLQEISRVAPGVQIGQGGRVG